jgi:AraC-like DNA-binding protein
VRLEADLAATDDLDEKTRLLDTFLLARLDTEGTYPAFAEQLGALVATDGITAAAPATATERRHRSRLFERHLGIPPRTVGRILRFQFTLRSLMRDPEGSLAELASEAGYYDQAHFIREFRLMTGGVPRGYRGYYPPDGPADFAPNVVAYVQDGPRARPGD